MLTHLHRSLMDASGGASSRTGTRCRGRSLALGRRAADAAPRESDGRRWWSSRRGPRRHGGRRAATGSGEDRTTTLARWPAARRGPRGRSVASLRAEPAGDRAAAVRRADGLWGLPRGSTSLSAPASVRDVVTQRLCRASAPMPDGARRRGGDRRDSSSTSRRRARRPSTMLDAIDVAMAARSYESGASWWAASSTRDRQSPWRGSAGCAGPSCTGTSPAHRGRHGSVLVDVIGVVAGLVVDVDDVVKTTTTPDAGQPPRGARPDEALRWSRRPRPAGDHPQKPTTSATATC